MNKSKNLRQDIVPVSDDGIVMVLDSARCISNIREPQSWGQHTLPPASGGDMVMVLDSARCISNIREPQSWGQHTLP